MMSRPFTIAITNALRCLLLLVLLVVLILIPRGAHADMGYYADTIATDQHDMYLAIRQPPVMQVEIHTSSQYLAGTVDNVYATFSGDFAVSGPHLLGTFLTGTATTLTLTLDRVIGRLQRVIFSTDGTDGWLYSSVICRMQQREYVLQGPQQWLQAFNPVSFKEHGDGYAASDYLWPASDSLVMNVTTSFAIIPQQ
jgi:hypothetical protein